MSKLAHFAAVFRSLADMLTKAAPAKAAPVAPKPVAAPAPAGHRRISQAGLDLIKQFEGLRLKSYLCPASVWTIGYGSTGPHVRQGMVISAPEAEALLRKDVGRFERAVEAMVKVTITQPQFDALVSFAFNVGTGALKSSTLLRKLNLGDYRGAADQLLRWNKAGKTVLPGLTKRRKAERALFLSGGV